MDKIPLLPKVGEYLQQPCIPSGTYRNWISYGEKVELLSDEAKFILCDPQPSCGLMIAVTPSAIAEVKAILAKEGMHIASFGKFVKKGERLSSEE